MTPSQLLSNPSHVSAALGLIVSSSSAQSTSSVYPSPSLSIRSTSPVPESSTPVSPPPSKVSTCGPASSDLPPHAAITKKSDKVRCGTTRTPVSKDKNGSLPFMLQIRDRIPADRQPLSWRLGRPNQLKTARVEGLEPPAVGFGIQCSTN